MTDTVADFLPQFLRRTVVKAVVVADDNPTVPYWTWSSGPGYDRSGDQYEYASLHDVNGEQWAFSDAFGNPDKHEWFPMEAVVDLVTRNGTTTDFAAAGKVQGCSYLPRDLPDSGEILIRQWFWLWSAKPENGGARVRPGFWEGRFTFGNTRANPDFPGGAIKVIELREVWWDADAKWVRGHPVTAGELPWNGDTPNLNIIVVPEQLDCIGYQVGHLWVGHDGNSSVHLKSIEYGPDTPPAPKPPEVKVADESLLIAALDRNTAAVDRNTAARLVSPTSPAPLPTATTPPSPGPSTTPAPSTSTTPTPTSSNETPIALNGTLPWPAPRTNARRFLSMRGSDVAALRLNVPANATGHFGSLELVYTTANMAHRDACLSMSPNDFDNPIAGSSIFRDVVSPRIPLCIAPVDDGAAVLQPGTTVYLNVRNVNVDADANCDAYISIIPTH